MLTVLGNKGYVIFYTCDCGVSGKCIIKPLSEGGAIVVDIRCPLCSAKERIKLLRDGSDDDGDFSWACVLYNEVTDYELKEDL